MRGRRGPAGRHARGGGGDGAAHPAGMDGGSVLVRLLLPRRPGLGWFLVGIAGIVLPLASVFSGPRWFVPVLIASVTLGVVMGIWWFMV